MANEIDINIGTFDLDDATNSVAIADINVSVAKSIQEFALPKYHGSVVPLGKRKSLRIRIHGTVKGTEYDNLRTKLDNLKAAFESDYDQKLTLDDDRFLKVQYANFASAWMS